MIIKRGLMCYQLSGDGTILSSASLVSFHPVTAGTCASSLSQASQPYDAEVAS